MDSKTCTRCGETKPLDEFSNSKAARDGKQPWCRRCKSENYAANRDRYDVARRAWYERNRERRSAYGKAHRAENRERIAERMRNYHSANPHVGWEASYRTRAKRIGFEPVIESFTKEQLVERWGPNCWHCKTGPFEHLDHYVTPVRSGGAHTLENCRPACARCNSSRNQYYEGAAFGRT